MLTLDNPEILAEIESAPAGIFPFNNSKIEENFLVIKCLREMILAAKICQGFRVYVMPVSIGKLDFFGLVTAFFDDPDEPLVIRTPLLDRQMCDGVKGVFSSRSFSVHFIDEHNRELLGYRAENLSSDKFNYHFPSYDTEQKPASFWGKVDDKISDWFSNRNEEDDANSYNIVFTENLIPEDLAILDTRIEKISHHGSRGAEITTLETINPGPSSEDDIAKCLKRVFPNDQIYSNPRRVDTGRELVDIMVVTKKNMLLIQAKDSPNTKQILSRTIDRKVSTTTHHFEKAAAQIHGTISYVNSSNTLYMQCGDDDYAISTDKLKVRAMIVVKELFSTEYKSYSRIVFEVIKNTGVTCCFQDYTELNRLTALRRSEKIFFDTIDQLVDFSIQHNEFPRLRIWK